MVPMCSHKMACGKQTKSNVSEAAALCFRLLMRNEGRKTPPSQHFHSPKAAISRAWPVGSLISISNSTLTVVSAT